MALVGSQSVRTCCAIEDRGVRGRVISGLQGGRDISFFHVAIPAGLLSMGMRSSASEVLLSLGTFCCHVVDNPSTYPASPRPPGLYLGCLDTVRRLYRVMAGYSISDGTQFEGSPFPKSLDTRVINTCLLGCAHTMLLSWITANEY
jgi:hypothetical protein